MEETTIMCLKEYYLLFSGCFALNSKPGLPVEDLKQTSKQVFCGCSLHIAPVLK